jgi:hypothetical protein
LNRKWYRQLKAANRAKMEDQGGRQLREIYEFGKKAALEKYFAPGVSPHWVL